MDRQELLNLINNNFSDCLINDTFKYKNLTHVSFWKNSFHCEITYLSNKQEFLLIIVKNGYLYIKKYFKEFSDLKEFFNNYNFVEKTNEEIITETVEYVKNMFDDFELVEHEVIDSNTLYFELKHVRYADHVLKIIIYFKKIVCCYSVVYTFLNIEHLLFNKQIVIDINNLEQRIRRKLNPLFLDNLNCYVEEINCK